MAEEKDNRKVVIELQDVKRYFQVGSETVKALRGVSFKIYEGEFVTIQGTYTYQWRIFPRWHRRAYHVEDSTGTPA